MGYTSSAFLQKVIAELDQIDAHAHQLFNTHDAATLNRHPRPDAWSAVQCFDHLVKINHVYLSSVNHALKYGKTPPRDNTSPFSHSLFERYFIWTLEPPARFKLPTRKIVEAKDGWLDPDTVQANYFETHKAFRDTLERIRQIDVKRTRVTSPIAAWLKWSTAAALEIMLAHERRHIWQAEKAVNGA